LFSPFSSFREVGPAALKREDIVARRPEKKVPAEQADAETLRGSETSPRRPSGAPRPRRDAAGGLAGPNSERIGRRGRWTSARAIATRRSTRATFQGLRWGCPGGLSRAFIHPLECLMLPVLVFAAAAHATPTFADVVVDGETPDAGVCTITLDITSDDTLLVFDDDGAPMGLSNVRWLLTDNGQECDEVDISGYYYEICGEDAVNADGDLEWSVSFETDDGDAGTWLVTDTGGTFTTLTTVASVDWSCGACELMADFNGDGTVSTADWLYFGSFFGQPVPAGHAADLTGDGMVDTDDLLIFLGEWGQSCP